MNIQIFGKKKWFDTKKAERYFKERNIRYQLIDLPKIGMSKGEYRRVRQAIGSLDALIDPNSKEYERCFMAYQAYESDKEERLLENPGMVRTPIVCNGKQATVGYCPDIWKTWE